MVGGPLTDSPFLWKDITVGITSQDQHSYLRRYSDFELRRVYPYLTAIINVEAGEVIGISWDDACEFCGSDTCEENTVELNGVEVTEESSGQPTKGCYITRTNCNTALAVGIDFCDPIICDVLVNVVWSGTDSTGKSFQSEGKEIGVAGWGDVPAVPLAWGDVPAVPLDIVQSQDPTPTPSLAPSTSASPTVVGWGGCVDPTLSSRDESNKVTIGAETNVCLQLGNGDDWAAAGVDFMHFNLQPKADEFTRFFLPLCTL
jgi:hypothetical protein